MGFQWMFLLYGLVGILVGISLLWWLPDRPLPPGETYEVTGWRKYIPQSRPALTGEDARIHYADLTRVYHRQIWTMEELWNVVIDWRLYPLVIMYFGVVGVGIGTQSYGTVIIRAINPKLTSIQLSLLFAPIWIVGRLASLLDCKLIANRWISLLYFWSHQFPIASTNTAPYSLAVRLCFKLPGCSSPRSRVPPPARGPDMEGFSSSDLA